MSQVTCVAPTQDSFYGQKSEALSAINPFTSSNASSRQLARRIDKFDPITQAAIGLAAPPSDVDEQQTPLSKCISFFYRQMWNPVTAVAWFLLLGYTILRAVWEPSSYKNGPVSFIFG